MAVKLLPLLLLAGRAYAKITTGVAKLTGEFTEHEVCKVAYSVGKNALELTVWLDPGKEYASDELRVVVWEPDGLENPATCGPSETVEDLVLRAGYAREVRCFAA